MKRSTMPVVSLVVALMLALVSAVAYAQQGDQRFTAQLSGRAEVPGPGDPDGSGMATVTINADEGEVCYELSWMNIMQPAAAAHIHEGAADVAGPVVVPLFTEPMQGTSASDCVSGDDDVLDAIMANPANYYVNVHNQEYPQGAIRGQLTMAATTMPGTGASSEDVLPFVGLALLALLAGFGLQRGLRRSASIR